MNVSVVPASVTAVVPAGNINVSRLISESVEVIVTSCIIDGEGHDLVSFGDEVRVFGTSDTHVLWCRPVSGREGQLCRIECDST